MTEGQSLPGTRERLIGAMVNALRERGLHGIGLNELLQRAQAPKGVLYHHFPGGKTALAVAAIEATVQRVIEPLSRLAAEPASDAVRPGAPFDPSRDPLLVGLREWLRRAEHHLAQTGYQQGCPLATVALESTPDDRELRLALAAGFAQLRHALRDALTSRGVPHERASGLASLVVAAYEGGLMQARVAGDPEPMHSSVSLLLEQIELALKAAATAQASASNPLPSQQP